MLIDFCLIGWISYMLYAWNLSTGWFVFNLVLLVFFAVDYGKRVAKHIQ